MHGQRLRLELSKKGKILNWVELIETWEKVKEVAQKERHHKGSSEDERWENGSRFSTVSPVIGEERRKE